MSVEVRQPAVIHAFRAWRNEKERVQTTSSALNWKEYREGKLQPCINHHQLDCHRRTFSLNGG